MIVGNGDIASVLPDRDDLLFFASGVSNSQETRESEYDREFDLLMKQDRSQRIVYFSTLAMFYSNTRYVQHKKRMELKIRQFFPEYCIVRLGNISWGTNPNTLINYLKANPDAELQDGHRFVIEQDEFLHWINLIPDFNCEMNLPGRTMTIKEIYNEYVQAP